MGDRDTQQMVASLRPDLVPDWHVENDMLPSEVRAGSTYRALWKCRAVVLVDGRQVTCEHEWRAEVRKRALQGKGCPSCAGQVVTDRNAVAVTNPNLPSEWAQSNTCGPHEVTSGSGRRIVWQCGTCDHEWVASVKDRAREGRGCPGCSGRVATSRNCVANTRQDLADEWCPTNRKSPFSVTLGSNYRAAWTCKKCEHRWIAAVADRALRGTGCPKCAGQVVTEANCIVTTHPSIAAEFSKRNRRGADSLTAGSNYRALWDCTVCGHSWRTAVHHRTIKGSGCPACSGRVATARRNLATEYPALMSQWSDRNPLPPENYAPQSSKSVIWVCEACGHEWSARIHARTGLGSGCPDCMLQSTSRDEIYLAHEIALFHDTVTGHHKVAGATRSWNCDVELPDERIVVEYDGAYWHADREQQDAVKTADLTAAGWTVIRVREAPLSLIAEHDIAVTAGQHKTNANAVLQRISDLTGINHPGLSAYLAADSPQNRPAADQQVRDLLAKRLARKARRAERLTAVSLPSSAAPAAESPAAPSDAA